MSNKAGNSLRSATFSAYPGVYTPTWIGDSVAGTKVVPFSAGACMGTTILNSVPPSAETVNWPPTCWIKASMRRDPSPSLDDDPVAGIPLICPL